MAMDYTLGILARMRERTREISAEAQKRTSVDRSAYVPKRFVIVTLGRAVRGSMASTFRSCR